MFTFTTPRYFTAYAESAFPYRFFVDGRDNSESLNTTVARGFFQRTQYPENFYRRNGTFGLQDIGADLNALAEAHPIEPGYNIGVGNYTLDLQDPGLNGVRHNLFICEVYKTCHVDC